MLHITYFKMKIHWIWIRFCCIGATTVQAKAIDRTVFCCSGGHCSGWSRVSYRSHGCKREPNGRCDSTGAVAFGQTMFFVCDWNVSKSSRFHLRQTRYFALNSLSRESRSKLWHYHIWSLLNLNPVRSYTEWLSTTSRIALGPRAEVRTTTTSIWTWSSLNIIEARSRCVCL